MTMFEHLPPELVATIVHLVNPGDLYACALVNQQCHTITNPLLWRSIKIDDDNASTQVMVGLMAMGKYVQQLELPASTTDAQLVAFTRHTRHLEALTLDDARELTDAGVRRSLRYCGKLLQKLVLHGYDALTEYSVLAISEFCPRLTDVCLLFSYGIPFPALLLLAPACPRLQQLNMWCDGDDWENNYDNGVAWDDWLARFRQLRDLTLMSVPPSVAQRLVNTLTYHPTWLPQLTDFYLEDCSALSEQEAIAFVKSHRGIQRLYLVPHEYTDTYLVSLASALPNLRWVRLSFGARFTNEGLRQFIKDCLTLEWIDVADCELEHDDFPEAGASSMVSYNKTFLQHLDMDAILSIRSGQGGWVEIEPHLWRWKNNLDDWKCQYRVAATLDDIDIYDDYQPC